MKIQPIRQPEASKHVPLFPTTFNATAPSSLIMVAGFLLILLGAYLAFGWGGPLIILGIVAIIAGFIASLGGEMFIP